MSSAVTLSRSDTSARRRTSFNVRRLARALASAWIAAVSLAGEGAVAQSPNGSQPLILGGPPITPYTNSIVAAEKGYFAEAGLKVERKTIFASNVVRTALVSGDIEVAAMAVDSLIRGHLAGLDWKILYPAVMYDPRRPDAYVVARSDVTITAPKDLEGKTVALTLGTMGEPAFKAWLRSEGGDPGRVRLVDIAFPHMIGALDSKRIDAAYMVDPFLTQALERGLVKIVGSNLDIVGDRFLVAAYVAKASWIAANAEKARRFTDALARATRFVIEHPTETLPIVAKVTRLEPQLVSKFFPARYVAAAVVKPDEIQRLIDFLAREKFIDREFEYGDIISKYMPIQR